MRWWISLRIGAVPVAVPPRTLKPLLMATDHKAVYSASCNWEARQGTLTTKTFVIWLLAVSTPCREWSCTIMERRLVASLGPEPYIRVPCRNSCFPESSDVREMLAVLRASMWLMRLRGFPQPQPSSGVPGEPRQHDWKRSG